MTETTVTSEERLAQYHRCGLILAETADRVGLDLSSTEQERWARVLGRIATWDDIFEADRSHFTPTQVVDHIFPTPKANKDETPVIRPRDLLLEGYAENLLLSSAAATDATDIERHFDYRAVEAICCVDMICHTTNGRRIGYSTQWRQIYRISVAGQYLDSVLDAKQDAEELQQFSTQELVLGGLKRFAAAARWVHPKAWKELLLASHNHGLDTYLLKKAGRLSSAAIMPATKESAVE